MNGGSSIARRTAFALACLATVALAAAGPALADDHGGNGSQSKPSTRHAPAVTSTSTPAPQSGTQSVRGVVQVVGASGVMVKQLDGSVVNVPVDRKTKVYLDGKPARLVDVKPGAILVASWKAGQPADTLRFVRPS